MRSVRVMLLVAMLAPAACSAAAGLKVIKTSDNYKILAGTEAKAGGKGKLILEIHTSAKWKFEPKAPILLDVIEARKVKLQKTKLRKQDVAKSEKQLRRFEVPFEGASGKHEIKFKFDFVICTETLCQKKRFELGVPLNAG